MKLANRHFSERVHLLRANFFLTVFFCLLTVGKGRAVSLKYEEANFLEETGTLAPAYRIKSRNGYIFLQSNTRNVIDVMTNGLSGAGVSLVFTPLNVLPNGGFVGVETTNHIVSLYDWRGQANNDFSAPPTDTGSSAVDAVAQSDGKIVVLISYVPGPVGPSVLRLNSDGSLDSSFKFQGFLSGRKVIVQPDDKILVLTDSNVIRFLSDGSGDPDFQVSTFSGGGGTQGQTIDFGLQPDGGIIVVGRFKTVNGFSRPGMARLLPVSGDVDVFFRPIDFELTYGIIGQMAMQSNGDIVIQSATTLKIRRFFNDGKLDKSFTPTVNGSGPGFGFGIDRSDKIILNSVDPSSFVQYSGRRRIRSSGSLVDQIFEQSSSIGKDATWSIAKTVPANTTLEFALPDSFDPGNHFFRLRSLP